MEVPTRFHFRLQLLHDVQEDLNAFLQVLCEYQVLTPIEKGRLIFIEEA